MKLITFINHENEQVIGVLIQDLTQDLTGDLTHVVALDKVSQIVDSKTCSLYFSI